MAVQKILILRSGHSPRLEGRVAPIPAFCSCCAAPRNDGEKGSVA